MKIEITEKALEYLVKNKAIGIIINLIPGETSGGCCGGRTRPYYTISVDMSFDNSKISKSYVEIYNKNSMKVYLLSSKLNIINDKDIIIDVEGVLFIKKLVLKNLEMILV